MAYVYPSTWFGDRLVPTGDASLSITSAAVLYGLSVYTVLPVTMAQDGRPLAFRISDHYRRLVNSARIIGIDTFEPAWDEERFIRGRQRGRAAPTTWSRTSSCGPACTWTRSSRARARVV